MLRFFRVSKEAAMKVTAVVKHQWCDGRMAAQRSEVKENESFGCPPAAWIFQSRSIRKPKTASSVGLELSSLEVVSTDQTFREYLEEVTVSGQSLYKLLRLEGLSR
eukprot:symbB.v1.2.005235.t1/scaffold302.1/size234775/4